MNKVNTKAEVRFVVDAADWLDSHTKERLKVLARGAINGEGELVVVSQKLRTQAGNLEDAISKLEALLALAATIPKTRELKTEPSEHAKAGWRDDKRARSDVKARRRGGGGRDDD